MAGGKRASSGHSVQEDGVDEDRHGKKSVLLPAASPRAGSARQRPDRLERAVCARRVHRLPLDTAGLG